LIRGEWFVQLLDVHSISASGRRIKDAKARVRDNLENYLEEALYNGAMVPLPSLADEKTILIAINEKLSLRILSLTHFFGILINIFYYKLHMNLNNKYTISNSN
jgi:hypothetical protein